jgi:hypothetical protein
MVVISMGDGVLSHRVKHGFHVSQGGCGGSNGRAVSCDGVCECFELLAHLVVDHLRQLRKLSFDGFKAGSVGHGSDESTSCYNSIKDNKDHYVFELIEAIIHSQYMHSRGIVILQFLTINRKKTSNRKERSH